jgi:hypothetical protein
MPKYLLEVNYTLDGIRGVKAHGGSARVAAATVLRITEIPHSRSPKFPRG